MKNLSGEFYLPRPLRSSRASLEDFFQENLIWRDMESVFRSHLEEAREALEDLGLEGEKLTYMRGVIANLRGVLDLPQYMLELKADELSGEDLDELEQELGDDDV